MRHITPKNVSDYPMYILIYWVIIWGLTLIYETFSIVLNLTDNKNFVIKTNDAGLTYYVPLGNAVTEMFIQTGILTGVITILVGYSWCIYKWSKKRK